MTAPLRVASLASLLFALPAHAQSAAEAPVSEPEPAPVAPVPAPPAAAQPAVNSAPTVNAPPRHAPTVDAPEEHEEWYGWQTLTTDAASVTFLVGFGVAAGRSNNDATETVFASACAGAYFLGGPIVHAAHGNWGRAAGSLGLRVGAPFVGSLLGLVIASSTDSSFDDSAGMGAVGALVGIGTAVVLDAAVLGYETVQDEPVVMPAMSTGKNGTWVGVTGRF